MRKKNATSSLFRKLVVSTLSRLVPIGLLVIQSRPRLRELILEALRSGPSGHLGILGPSGSDQDTLKPLHFDGSWKSSITKAHLVALNCPALLPATTVSKAAWEKLSSLPYVLSQTVIHEECLKGVCSFGSPASWTEALLCSKVSFPHVKPGELIVLAPINNPPNSDSLRELIFQLQASSHACLWTTSQQDEAPVIQGISAKGAPTEFSFHTEPPPTQQLILGDTLIIRSELWPWIDATSGVYDPSSSSRLQLTLTKNIAKQGWTHSHTSSSRLSRVEVRKLIERLKLESSSEPFVFSIFDFHLGARKQLSLAIRTDSPSSVPKSAKRLLIIQPILGGGLVHADAIMSDAAMQNFEIFWLSTTGNSIGLYKKDGDSGSHVRIFSETFEPVNPQSHRSASYDSFLLKSLINLRIDLVLIQHLSNQSLGIRDVCDSLGVKFVVAAHDFYVGCMSHNLLDEENNYCGGVCTPGTGPCKTVAWPSAEVSNLKNGLVTDFRQGTSIFLRGATGNVFPDPTTKIILESIHGEIFSNSLVLPFPIPEALSAPSRKKATRRVVVIGDLRENKGVQLIKKLAPALMGHGIEVHIIGSAHPSLMEVGVHHGPYKPENLPNIVKSIEPDLAIMASPWPETFSFVLSEALCMGLPVVARKLGAFATRLEGQSFARLVDSNDTEQWTLTILDVYSSNNLEIMRSALFDWQKLSDSSQEKKKYGVELNRFLERAAG